MADYSLPRLPAPALFCAVCVGERRGLPELAVTIKSGDAVCLQHFRLEELVPVVITTGEL